MQANENLKPDPHPAQLRPDLTTLSKSINNRQLTALVTGSLSGRHTFLIIFRPKAHWVRFINILCHCTQRLSATCDDNNKRKLKPTFERRNRKKIRKQHSGWTLVFIINCISWYTQYFYGTCEEKHYNKRVLINGVENITLSNSSVLIAKMANSVKSNFLTVFMAWDCSYLRMTILGDSTIWEYKNTRIFHY